MCPVDVGGQTISVKYFAPGNSAEVNERFLGIRPVGIYSGGFLSVVNTSNAQISTLVCEISDGTHQVRVETTAAVSLSVAAATPYVVLRWGYTGDTNDYMELLAVSSANVRATDVVVGKCVFVGGALSEFDYGDATHPRTYPNVLDLNLKVIPAGALRVWVLPGWVQSNLTGYFVPLQKSSSLTPPASNSKIYLVYIDPTDGTVNVDSSGASAATPVAPSYAQKIVLAEITLAAGASSIAAANIKDVRAFLNAGLPGVDGTTITQNSDNELAAVAADYLVLQDSNDQVNSLSTWTKLTFSNKQKVLGVSESSGVVTLKAGKLYAINYSVDFDNMLTAYAPYGSVRLRVLSGDVSWGFQDDDENVSLKKHQIATYGTDGTLEKWNLSGSCIILPSVNTTIELEAKTRDGTTNYRSKVISCNLNVVGR